MIMNEARIAKGSAMLAATGFIAAAMSQVAWSEFFSAPYHDHAGIEWSLRIFRDVAWLGASCVLVSSGIALSRQGIWRRRVLSRAVPGLVALIVPVIISALTFHTMKDMLDAREVGKARVAELAASVIMDKSASLEARFVFTQAYALQVWKDSGKTIDYIDEGGDLARFVPSDSQRLEAAREAAILSRTEHVMDSAIAGIRMNLLLLAACVVVGVFVRIRLTGMD